MPFHFRQPGDRASFWEDGASDAPPPASPLADTDPTDALAQFLPELTAASPAPDDSRATRKPDPAHMDDLLSAVNGRLHSLDANLDRLQALSVQLGEEYRRLALEAQHLHPSVAADRTPLALDAAAAPATVAPPPSAPDAARHRIVFIPRGVGRTLDWLRTASLPVAAALAGFVLAPSASALLQPTFETHRLAIAPSTHVASLAPPATTTVAAAPRARPGIATPVVPVTSTETPRAAVTTRTPRPAAGAGSIAAPVILSLTSSTGKTDPSLALMAKPTFAGTLQIRSEPAGAAVYLNQQYVGATPLRLPRVRAGSHVIWIEQPGYDRWTAGVLVPTDAVTELHVTLTPQHGGQ